MLCAAHNTEQVLFILSQAVRAPDLHFWCLYSSQISSPSYVTLFTSPHSGQSPLLCCLITFLITFLWCLCFWEFRVELEECSEGCKWGMDVCTCRSLSATCYRTGNLLPAFLPFPCPFYAFAYPRKPVHCQNRTFLALCLMFFALPESQNCKCQYLGGKNPKDFLGLFVCSKENKQDKHNGKNAWSALWGLLNDSNREAEMSGFMQSGVSRSSKILKVIFETVGTH